MELGLKRPESFPPSLLFFFFLEGKNLVSENLHLSSAIFPPIFFDGGSALVVLF